MVRYRFLVEVSGLAKKFHSFTTSTSAGNVWLILSIEL